MAHAAAADGEHDDGVVGDQEAHLLVHGLHTHGRRLSSSSSSGGGVHSERYREVVGYLHFVMIDNCFVAKCSGACEERER